MSQDNANELCLRQPFAVEDVTLLRNNFDMLRTGWLLDVVGSEGMPLGAPIEGVSIQLLSEGDGPYLFGTVTTTLPPNSPLELLMDGLKLSFQQTRYWDRKYEEIPAFGSLDGSQLTQIDEGTAFRVYPHALRYDEHNLPHGKLTAVRHPIDVYATLEDTPLDPHPVFYVATGCFPAGSIKKLASYYYYEHPLGTNQVGYALKPYDREPLDYLMDITEAMGTVIDYLRSEPLNHEYQLVVRSLLSVINARPGYIKKTVE